MNRFIEHIINDLVRDTKIDYDKEEILTRGGSPIYFVKDYYYFFFIDYCKDTYGLTEDEIEYVWDQYKGIILDKIKNRQ